MYGDDSTISWRGITIPHFPPPPQYWCYLVHFNTPYKHARHYLGSTGCLDARLDRHRAGNGARLLEVVSQAGITWQLARLWRVSTWQESRDLERELKRWHGSGQFCPVCRGLPLDADTLVQRGGWPLRLHSEQARARRPMPRHQNVPFSRS